MKNKINNVAKLGMLLGLRSRLPRWTAVLALLIAPVATPVMAQETGTVTITGTFTSDSGEHAWSLTLYGTTHSHSQGWVWGWYSYYTDVQATSFDLQFTGPDADDLNRVASERFAGGKAGLQLRNTYDYGDLSTMALWVSSPDESATFRAGNDGLFTGGVFPSDADGYPIVTPEPFPFWNEATHISWYGEFFADTGPDADFFPNAQISGSLGQPPPPPPLPTLGIGDASVVEGDRGSSKMRFTVSRSGSRFRTVSVSYRTVDGTASANSDYSAASGTLTFPTGISTLTITIAVTGDRKREPNETFTVELFNAVGASLVDAVATGTILNDD